MEKPQKVETPKDVQARGLEAEKDRLGKINAAINKLKADKFGDDLDQYFEMKKAVATMDRLLQSAQDSLTEIERLKGKLDK